MSEYADDLKYDYSSELQGTTPDVNIYIECEYEVKIIHRTSGKCEWSGTVMANSKKAAQKEFRNKYPHIRAQYSHAYGLGIRKV